ncbi:cytoplasmic protein ['Osedax' symbiont bacterium Rs2_46_30_T18]|nr:cytoplasmic protein ['Osedax' symbiont bacterium Rs2_46_30_T18]
MNWDLSKIEESLSQQSNWVVHSENDCLFITNEDGLDAYVAVSGAQIVVESILFASSSVADIAGLNEQILKTHQVFPLTTIGITSVENEDYYMAFGALSSQSKEESIIIEVETLFDNVAAFLDAYEDYLK